MKSLAIIIDSFATISQKETLENKDFFFLPLRFFINNEEFEDDGLKYTKETTMKMISTIGNIKTSQPKIIKIEKLFFDLSKKYKKVIYLPLSSVLSGTYKVAKNIASLFPNVEVYNNLLVGKTFIQFGKKLQTIFETTNDYEKVENFIKEYNTDKNIKSIFIPENVSQILKGGRIGKVANFLMTKIRAYIIIGFDNLIKLRKKSIKRTIKKAVEYSIEELFLDKDKDQFKVLVSYTITKQTLYNETIKQLEKLNIPYEAHLTSSTVVAQTGLGAISITVYRKMDNFLLEKKVTKPEKKEELTEIEWKETSHNIVFD